MKNILTEIMSDCGNVNLSEQILVVTDFDKMKVAQYVNELIIQLGYKTDMVVMPTRSSHGEEPTDDISEKMMHYPVQFLITSKSLSHTAARRKATHNGSRIVSMPLITKDIIKRCLDIDYLEIKERNYHLRNIISDKKINITTPFGTDLSVKLKNTYSSDCGCFDKPGMFINLPSGEVDSGIIPEETNGVFYADCSFGEYILQEPYLQFHIRMGKIEKIDGKYSTEIIALLEKCGSKAFSVAEFGIGTNPKATITGNPLEDEKVLGTCHIGIGNDLYYGGENDVPIHIDAISSSPTIKIGSDVIIENGLHIYK